MADMPVGRQPKPSKAQKDADAFRSGKRVKARGAEHYAAGSGRKTLAQQIKEHRRGGGR